MAVNIEAHYQLTCELEYQVSVVKLYRNFMRKEDLVLVNCLFPRTIFAKDQQLFLTGS